MDTNSYSLTGEYNTNEQDIDEILIQITHGYSKDYRPDLKQVVQEMIVSQDGGVPMACKNWDEMLRIIKYASAMAAYGFKDIM